MSLGFFSDIIVPNYHFPEDYWFQSAEKVWVWKYDRNDMFLEADEDIRFVCNVRFLLLQLNMLLDTLPRQSNAIVSGCV